MNKIFFIICIILLFNNVFGQNYCMTQPEGYGAAATGGGNVTSLNTVTVTTYTEFKNALTSTSIANSVILVSGVIDCLYTSVTLNNKTIIGLPGARLRNNQITVGNFVTSAQNSGILNIKPGSNNVIIRNLIFEGPGAYDVDGRDNLTTEATNLWVDHCEFQDGLDGNFDIKGLADNTTVSWCKFTYLKPAISGGSGGSNDHRFSGLVGSSGTDFPIDGHYSVTFQNCYWTNGCKERMPRARNAELHILNCYYNTNVSSSTAIGLGGGDRNLSCFVENSNFASITYRYKNYNTTDGGTVAITFNNCLNLNGTANVGTVAPPTYSYSVIPVNDVATYIPNITCGAGATLNVSTTGALSTSCPNVMGLTEIKETININYYPTFIENEMNIEFPNEISGEAKIAIYSISGQRVLSQTASIFSLQKNTFNLTGLSSGLYLVKLQINQYSSNWKIIKK
jgi:pectate lyase